MTDTEAAIAMLELADSGDPEDAHFKADKLLCTILKDLGYVSTVRIYEGMVKWY